MQQKLVNYLHSIASNCLAYDGIKYPTEKKKK